MMECGVAEWFRHWTWVRELAGSTPDSGSKPVCICFDPDALKLSSTRCNPGQCVSCKDEEKENHHNDAAGNWCFAGPKLFTLCQAVHSKSYIFAQQYDLPHCRFGKWHGVLSRNIGAVAVGNSCEPFEVALWPSGISATKLTCQIWPPKPNTVINTGVLKNQ